MSMPVLDVKALREAVCADSVDMPEMQPVLDLYRDLFDTVTEPLPPGGMVRLPSPEEAKLRMEEGFRLLDLPGLLPSTAALERRATEVLGILARHTELPPAGSAALGKGGIIKALAAGYLEGGEDRLRTLAAQAENVNAEVAVFMVFNALKGAFMAAAGSLGGIDTESWMRKECPVCGGAAAAACFAGEGGARHLVCHRCHTRWRVARIFCPSCGNMDHDSLGYFTIEGREAGPRVDHCQKCSGYIKTWDIREREDLLPEAEDLKTPAVDGAARQEGFFRPGPNMFGIVSSTAPVSKA